MRREAAFDLVSARLGVLEGRRGAVDASFEEKQEGEQQARRAWGGTVGRKGHVGLCLERAISPSTLYIYIRSFADGPF